MFDYSLFGKYPWEDNIEPDGENEMGEFYVERDLTKYLRNDPVSGDPVPNLEDAIVALHKPFDDAERKTWVILNPRQYIANTQSLNIEEIGCLIDVWRYMAPSKPELKGC